MNVVVVVPGALRQFTDGAAKLDVEVPADATVRTLFARLAEEKPALQRRLQDEAGTLRRHVNVFVGEENIRDTGQLDTPLREGTDVTVLPAVSGG